MEHFLTVDILSIIAEYLDNVKDFIHLFQINKFVYNNILNNNGTVLRNKIFKNVIIYLNERLPNYLFQLQNLNIEQQEENDINNFNLLNKFNYLKYLEIENLPENFIFPNLPLLEELIITKSNLQENTLINLQHQLKNLDLYECTSNDNCLNYLNNLQKLKLWDCQGVSGKCLKNFKQLTKLEIYCHENNHYTKYISDLTNLKYLTLDKSNSLTNTNFLQKLINLEYLSIFIENVVSENCFTNLINLKELDVSNSTCNFTGKCLLNLTNLERLYVQSTNVKDEYLKNLKNLKEVNFGYCYEITGECLLYLNNLEDLYISNNDNLKDEYFKNLNNLKFLNIYHCNGLNGEFLKYLPKLKEFHFRQLNISDEYLKRLKNLKRLSLIQCPNITGEFLLNLINLKYLYVEGVDNLKDEYLINLQNLQKLQLNNCDKIIGTCLLKLPNLTSLNIDSNNMIDDHLQNLPNLQQLYITKCPNLTEKCFDYLINLKELSIHYNTTLKEDALEKLINLNYLYIYVCQQLTKEGKYLLQMDKLNSFCLGTFEEFEGKNKIKELKERIRKGETLEKILQF
ncbi:hypothetical protein ABK040_014809 [Willaertia magna]